jgi:uracil-DNA glycosylase family 4
MSLKHYYLQQMGIETWVLRTPAKSKPDIRPATSNLEQLATLVANCKNCPLHQTRTQTVFARGNPHAKLMIVGEAPGFHDDQQGLPFVGKSAQLLSNMLKSVGYSDSDSYFANVLKCRPPDDRFPQDDEIKQCGDYLTQQIAIIKPTLILAVGIFAGQFLLNRKLPLHKMRDKLHDYQGARVLVTYHPADLLRSPVDKKMAYRDLLRAHKLMNEI